MLRISEKSIKGVEIQASKMLVGEICKIIEEIQKSPIKIEQPLVLLKELIKNKIYENGRLRTALEKKFSEGMTHFEVNFAKSTPKE